MNSKLRNNKLIIDMPGKRLWWQFLESGKGDVMPLTDVEPLIK